MKKLKCVLLVDDDSINNFINERLIKKIDLTEEVNISLNGKEALEYLLKRSSEGKNVPELILLDINMPVMDGFEFLDSFQKLELPNKNSIIIVMLTTSTNPSDTERLENTGVAGYINKPLTEQKLKDAITKHF